MPDALSVDKAGLDNPERYQENKDDDDKTKILPCTERNKVLGLQVNGAIDSDLEDNWD